MSNLYYPYRDNPAPPRAPPPDTGLHPGAPFLFPLGPHPTPWAGEPTGRPNPTPTAAPAPPPAPAPPAPTPAPPAPTYSGPRSSYDDSLFHLISKPFPDATSRSALPGTHASPEPHFTTAHLRATPASAVFDPNDFPSLAAAISTPAMTAVPPPGLLAGAATPTAAVTAVPGTTPGPTLTGTALPTTSIPTPTPGADALSFAGDFALAPYGDGRAKAVDALVGAASAEFNVHSEDFPALGGAPVSSPSRSPERRGTSATTASPTRHANGFALDRSPNGIPTPFPLLARLAPPKTTTPVTRGASSLSERFGMKALLPVVLPLADGSSDNILSIGLDLTALGLNLNSPEPLHKTFDHPWEGGQRPSPPQPPGAAAAAAAAAAAVAAQAGTAPNALVAAAAAAASASPKRNQPDYKLPTCYYMQPPSLRSSHFTKFQLETLFYIFYNMPRDVLQLLAAVELYNRKWRFHKNLKLWFCPENVDTTTISPAHDRMAFTYFDIKSWERRPFQEANQSFLQGLMTEEELIAYKIPPL